MTISEYKKSIPSSTPTVVAYFLREGDILLGKRIKVSQNLGKDLYSGIGGKVGDEEGYEHETYEEAMKREAVEEVGVQIMQMEKVAHMRFYNPHMPKWNLETVVYFVYAWEGDICTTDVIEPVWFSREAIPYDLMWRDTKYWLPQILEGERLKGEFLFDENGVVEYELVPFER